MESNIKSINNWWYCFRDIIKIEDFDLDNISENEKWYENILVYNISDKHLLNLCVLDSIK